MVKELLEIIHDFIVKLFSTRTFILGLVFVAAFCILGARLFDLQIINGEAYQENYMAMTEKTVKLTGTRGNIYDRNGNLLAYDQLAYDVTVQDNGDFDSANDRNLMLLRLVRILHSHGENVQGEFSIGINSQGEMVYTTSSETSTRRFIADHYGLRSTSDLDKDGKYPSSITAREIFESRKQTYGLNDLVDENGEHVELTDREALDIINIRYSMSFTAYRKYEATTVATNVSKETMTDILENSADLTGVNIEESTIRVYNDSIYFAQIIGYTGKVWEDELDTLREANPDYELNDIVGKTGIEASMELELQGKKARRQCIRTTSATL